ncbi:MAG TPA: hypothetical protein VM165_24070 [Planctomycetaceae bacterium]|nr:hypothetical protein [Planctomycetaceae bacterium]
MIYVVYAFATLGILFAAFIGWRYTSVARGRRQRDEKLLRILDPIGYRLSKKEKVTADEIATLSRQPKFRPMLYRMLEHFERLDLFPSEHLSISAQGAGILSYWMMHPNELQDAPESIELVEEVKRRIRGGRASFLVFRYRMIPGHWAEKDGWLLGLAGPFFDDDLPYSGIASGFSRCGDKYGVVKPSELIDWYIGIQEGKR